MSAVAETSISLGAVWYAELWPEASWDADIARMKEAGITCVRLFERSWGRFEPSEWSYDFDWAVRLLDRLRDAGIGAIVCTPTSAPPSWMISRYPEILRVGPDGKRAAAGQARLASMTSSRYREFCTRIVDQMIHAFRGHEAVIGWSIDSRIGGADFGAESRRAFHTWLNERLGSVDQLNRTWGLDYGGQAMEYFDQMPLPANLVGSGPIDPASRPHPSLAINFQRYINDQWSTYIHPQVEAIRGAFDKPVAAVMNAGEWTVNWFRLNHLLDRVTVGVGPVDQTPANLLMYYDRARAEKPGTAFWISDITPNWQADGAVTRIADPNYIRGMMWLGALCGARGVLFQNLRAAPAGMKMLDGALLTATGKPAPNFQTIRDTGAQLKEQAAWLDQHPPQEARIAIVVSNESAWLFSVDPMEPDLNYIDAWREEFYLPLVRAQYWRDVIDQTQDFCPYHVIVFPMVPLLHRQTLERLTKWVEEGGCLLVGPMTAIRNDQGAAFTDSELGGMEALIGASSVMRFPSAEPVVMKWEAVQPPPPQAAPGDPVPDEQQTAVEPSAAHEQEAIADQGVGSPPPPADAAPAGSDAITRLPTFESPSGLGESDVAPASGAAINTNAAPTVPDSTAHGWCEAFEATTAQALARYSGGTGDGAGAVLLHRIGKGTVITMAARVDPATYLDLVGALCDIAGVKPLVEGSTHVAVVPRMNPNGTVAACGLVNTSDQPQTVMLPAPGVDRLTGVVRGPEVTLAPHEVALVEMSETSPDAG